MHWFDKKTLTRKYAAISCSRFAGRHTYDRVVENIMNTHLKFKLLAAVTHTVTDNGSNFVKCFKVGVIKKLLIADKAHPMATEPCLNCSDSGDETDSSDEYEESQFVYHASVESILEPLSWVTEPTDDFEIEQFIDLRTTDIEDYQRYSNESSSINYALPKHIRCFSHSLNLVATTDSSKALRDETYKTKLLNALEKAKKLWNTIGRCPQASEKVFDCIGAYLPRPNATRWNSMYDSLNALLRDKSKLLEVCIVTSCYKV